MNESPARGGPAPHCSVAGMGADGPQGAAAWETGSAMGGGVSEKGSGDGDLGVLQDRVPALVGVAGCKVGSPEEEPHGGSSHLGGLTTGRGGIAGGGGVGGDGGGDGGCLDGDGGGGGCCCCRHCSGGGGALDDPSGHGVSLEGWGGRN